MKKCTLIFVIMLLIFSVNGMAKTFNNTSILNSILVLENNIRITINKNTSDKEIAEIMVNLNKQNIKAEFTNIQRNDSDEIIGISINITKNGSTSSYSTNSNRAINNIIIDIDGEFINVHSDVFHVLGLGNQDELTKVMQEKMTIFNNQLRNVDMEEFQKNMKEQMTVFKDQFDNMDELKKMMEQQKKLFSSFHFNFDTDEYENGFSLHFSDPKDAGLQNLEEYDYQQETKATYIVNGEEMTKEAYENIDKSKIKSLQIKKEVIKSYKK